MKLVAIMPCRNEDWIIGFTLRAVLKWVDAVVVLDHASVDKTPQILAQIESEFSSDRVILTTWEDPVWKEMAQRQSLLYCARHIGATHVAYVDADECLSGDLLPHIRDWAAGLPHGTMLSLPWLQLRGGIERVHTEGVWGSQCASTIFRDHSELHWAARNGYDFHQREPLGQAWRQCYPVSRNRRTGGLMHFQFTSDRRLFAKQYLYQLTERLRWPDRKTPAEIAAMYGQTVDWHMAPTTDAAVPEAWFEPYRDLLVHLHMDAEPWQLEECRKVIRGNPGIIAELNDFGLNVLQA